MMNDRLSQENNSDIERMTDDLAFYWEKYRVFTAFCPLFDMFDTFVVQ